MWCLEVMVGKLFYCTSSGHFYVLKEVIHTLRIKSTLTDLVLDFISHTGYFIEQTQWLIHPLINHTKMRQNLMVRRKLHKFQ